MIEMVFGDKRSSLFAFLMSDEEKSFQEDGHLVGGDGSDSPALLTAMTRNWYHLPSLSPGTRASRSSMVATQFWNK